MTDQQRLPQEIIAYYNLGKEDQRLKFGPGQLEFIRTQELVQRYLQAPPATILDVGGGSGIYAYWLAELGYTVHLIDAVPLHIEQAKAAQSNSKSTLVSIQVGDARKLPQPDNSVDAVLMLGPLYHLTERADRIKALQEAYRVLKPGGFLCAAAISRFASFLDGLIRGFLANPVFAQIVEQDLRSGQHRGTGSETSFFTTAYFHHPTELVDELHDAQFTQTQVLAIEGLGWLTCDFEAHWQSDEQRTQILNFIRSIESDVAILGASAHLMGIGQK